MSTLFLFSSHLNDDGCLCLRLDKQGLVDLPLEVRTHQEIRSLQVNARTLVIMPTSVATLHRINLPWLNDQKSRAAIPYAMEDQLAQPVDSIHVCFDREHYQDEHYLVVAIDKLFLSNVMKQLDAYGLGFDKITIDWFALNSQEACITEKGLLVNDNFFKGMLHADLASMYLANPDHLSTIITFSDSCPILKKNEPDNAEISYVWIAQRLLQANSINLCQGELRHDTHKYGFKHWYLGCAALASVCILSALFFNAYQLYLLTKKTRLVDQEIAVVYKHFFPGAQQIISPRFRVEQLLKNNGSVDNSSTLWTLMDKFGLAFTNNPLTIEHSHFQGKTLSVTLVAKDFADLEKFELRLQKQRVKVTQSQAGTRDKQVVATLELTL